MKFVPASRAARVAWAIVASAAGVVLIAWFSRDPIAKYLILRTARTAIPAEVRLDRVHTGIFPLSLRLTGLAVGNPAGYPTGNAFRVEDFYIRLAPGAFKGPTNQIEEIRLNISEVSVISKPNGRNNFKDLFEPATQYLSSATAAPSAPGRSGEPPESFPANPAPSEPAQPGAIEPSDVQAEIQGVMAEYAGEKPFRIGALTLRMGVVDVRTERDAGKKPKQQHIEINGEHTIHDVTDLEAAQQELGSAMLIRAMPSLLHDAMKDR